MLTFTDTFQPDNKHLQPLLQAVITSDDSKDNQVPSSLPLPTLLSRQGLVYLYTSCPHADLNLPGR